VQVRVQVSASTALRPTRIQQQGRTAHLSLGAAAPAPAGRGAPAGVRGGSARGQLGAAAAGPGAVGQHGRVGARRGRGAAARSGRARAGAAAGRAARVGGCRLGCLWPLSLGGWFGRAGWVRGSEGRRAQFLAQVPCTACHRVGLCTSCCIQHTHTLSHPNTARQPVHTHTHSLSPKHGTPPPPTHTGTWSSKRGTARAWRPTRSRTFTTRCTTLRSATQPPPSLPCCERGAGPCSLRFKGRLCEVHTVGASTMVLTVCQQ